MRPGMHKIEVLVDKIIPYCLVLLLAIITLDLGFKEFVEAHHLHPYILGADYIVIGVFVVDLIFKYMRTKHLKDFFRKFWLDILAVFPFFLVFRAFEFAIGAWGQTAQSILHESLEIEKEGAKVLREGEKFLKEGSRVVQEAEKIGKIGTRTSRFTRFLRPLARIPRFFKAIPEINQFYEKPTGEHHQHEFMHKHAKKK
ncbi:MAG: hypothetical protein V1729_00655 [Candidatus Woesearchaeota archaeon]